jgi:hypothetical protein
MQPHERIRKWLIDMQTSNMNHILKLLIFSCFLVNSTPIVANIDTFNRFASDSVSPKKPRKLATDPTYKPFNKQVEGQLTYGAIFLFLGGISALLIAEYTANLFIVSQLLLLGLAFILLYGGFFTILWGLLTLLFRWMKSVNRRRVMDNRKKVKWWFWILLALIVIWFIAMVLILGL